MTSLTRSIAALSVLLSVVPLCKAETSPQPASAPAVFEYRSEVPDFLRRLKDLADSGDLFNSASVSKQLGMQFRTDTKEAIPQPPTCENVWDRRSTITTTLASTGTSWYRDLPTGVPKMQVPEAFINPATSTGSTNISYRVTRVVSCSDRFGLQDRTEAVFSFGNLPAYACISVDDIRWWFPQAKFQTATDGVSLFWYQGKQDDDVGVRVQIVYRAGAQCALDATVTQDQLKGLRYERAVSKRANCRVKTDRDFCVQHGPITWHDGQMLDEMEIYADKVCGTVDWLAHHDAESGAPAAPWPRRKPQALPCDAYEQ